MNKPFLLIFMSVLLFLPVVSLSGNPLQWLENSMQEIKRQHEQTKIILKNNKERFRWQKEHSVLVSQLKEEGQFSPANQKLTQMLRQMRDNAQIMEQNLQEVRVIRRQIMQFFRVLQSEVDKIDNPELQQNAKQKLQFFKTRITEDKQKNQLQQFLTRGNQFLEKLQKPRRNRKLLRIAQERIVELQRKTQFFLQNSNKEKHISDEDRKKLEELDQRLTEAMEKLPIARETVPNIRHQRRNPGKETVTHQVDTSPK